LKERKGVIFGRNLRYNLGGKVPIINQGIDTAEVDADFAAEIIHRSVELPGIPVAVKQYSADELFFAIPSVSHKNSVC
jgi:hypothetical protein